MSLRYGGDGNQGPEPRPWVLSSSGTLEEVGGTRRKASGDRTSSLCQVGKTQTPVTALISVPVETVCPVFGDFDCGTRPQVSRWELGGSGAPSAAQALGPSEAKLSP